MSYTKAIRNRRLWVNKSTQPSGTVTNQVIDLDFGGSRSGTKVLDHRSKIAAGSNAGSEFSMDQWTNIDCKMDTAVLKYRSSVNPLAPVMESRFEGNFCPYPAIPHLTWDTSAMESACLSKVYSKIRAQKTTMNGMNFLGEIRETMQMLRRPAGAILNQLDKHFTSLENTKRSMSKKSKHVRQSDWAKAVSGSVLELNFGLMPLISDSKDIALALAKVVAGHSPRERLVARSSQERALTYNDTSGPSGAPFMSVIRNSRTTTTRRIQYVVGMNYAQECADSAISSLQNQLGFTAENILPTIYELTPWSWLMDYFTNVGKLLEAGTTDTSNVRWIVKTVSAITIYVSTTDFDWRTIRNSLAGSNLVLMGNSGGFGSAILIRRNVIRTTPSVLGMPSFVLSHPGESFTHMANVLSVLDQRRKGLEEFSSSPYTSLRSNSRKRDHVWSDLFHP